MVRRRRKKGRHPIAMKARRPNSGGRAADSDSFSGKKTPGALYRPSPIAWAVSNGALLSVLVAAMAYAYWPTLEWMAENWIHEPDYSHGWLVLPLAASIAWVRRDSFPGIATDPVCWSGLSLVAFALAIRIIGRLVYADFMDAWSLVFLIGGCVWVVFGRAALLWSLPAVAFLFFAIPIPYQAESLLSFKLQGVATAISTAGLRVIGQPAVAEGHLIWVGAEKLNIEPACSGLRIFVGLMATAYYFAAVSARTWGDRIVLITSVIPVALVANSTRIVVTGWLYQWTQSATARHAIHDYSGLLMIPLGFALMYGVYRYWAALYRPLEQVVAKDFLQPV